MPYVNGFSMTVLFNIEENHLQQFIGGLRDRLLYFIGCSRDANTMLRAVDKPRRPRKTRGTELLSIGGNKW